MKYLKTIQHFKLNNLYPDLYTQYYIKTHWSKDLKTRVANEKKISIQKPYTYKFTHNQIRCSIPAGNQQSQSPIFMKDKKKLFYPAHSG